jgi:hypothetical protein
MTESNESLDLASHQSLVVFPFINEKNLMQRGLISCIWVILACQFLQTGTGTKVVKINGATQAC